jgi:undecaprenyl diphosphate synthase
MSQHIFKEKLLSEMDPRRLPTHVAIIMDGNGRWAKQRHLPRIEGHRRAIKAVREAVEGCCEAGIKYLTLYTFSLENWQRPEAEVSALMKLLVQFLYDEIDEMNRNGVRLHISGRKDNFSMDILKAMDYSLASTRNNTKLVLNLALNYSSRAELEDAVKSIAREVKEGRLAPEDITGQLISNHLYSPWIPDPDLMIRTSGELRISNFMLWQLAYTELYFTPVLWPDFSRNDLYQAILDYQHRDRRFGKVK